MIRVILVLFVMLVWEKILEEISKCEIRCKNCHSLKTAERGGWWITVL